MGTFSVSSIKIENLGYSGLPYSDDDGTLISNENLTFDGNNLALVGHLSISGSMTHSNTFSMDGNRIVYLGTGSDPFDAINLNQLDLATNSVYSILHTEISTATASLYTELHNEILNNSTIQNITLSGDIIGSGTNSIVTTVSNVKITNITETPNNQIVYGKSSSGLTSSTNLTFDGNNLSTKHLNITGLATYSNTISLGQNKIINLATGSNPLDAVNFGQQASTILSATASLYTGLHSEISTATASLYTGLHTELVSATGSLYTTLHSEISTATASLYTTLHTEITNSTPAPLIITLSGDITGSGTNSIIATVSNVKITNITGSPTNQIVYSGNSGLTSSSSIIYDNTAKYLTVSGTMSVSQLLNSNLTSGRVVYSTNNGQLKDSINLTFDGNNLSTNNLNVSGLATHSNIISMGQNKIINLATGSNPLDAVNFGQLNALVTGVLIYQGLWNASTNSPTLVSSTGTKGYMYKVSVTGSTLLDGISQWNVGDNVIFDGTTWDKLDGISTEVLSVFGRVGNVIANTGDYTASQVTNAADITSSYSNPSWISTLNWSKITGTPTTMSGYNITDGITISQLSSATASLYTGLHNELVSATGSLYTILHSEISTATSSLYTTLHNEIVSATSSLYTGLHNEISLATASLYTGLHNEISSATSSLYTILHTEITNSTPAPLIITLSGDIIGSGTNSIITTVSNVKVTNITGTPTNQIIYGSSSGLTSSNNLIFDGSYLTLSGTFSINKIINLATGSNPLDAINFGQQSFAISTATASLYTGLHNEISTATSSLYTTLHSEISTATQSIKNSLITLSGDIIGSGTNSIVTTVSNVKVTNITGVPINQLVYSNASGLTSSSNLTFDGNNLSISNINITGIATYSNIISMSSNKVINLATGSNPLDAINFGQQSSAISNATASLYTTLHSEISTATSSLYTGLHNEISTATQSIQNSLITLSGDITGSGTNSIITIAHTKIVNVLGTPVNQIAYANLSGLTSSSNLTFDGSNFSTVNLTITGFATHSNTISMGSNKIINLATGSNPLDAVNFGQMISQITAASMSGPTGSVGPTGSSGSGATGITNSIAYFNTYSGLTSSSNLTFDGNNLFTNNLNISGIATHSNIISMGSNKIINLATGSNPLDAVNYNQLSVATQSLQSRAFMMSLLLN